jgi:hypothetical protein
MTDWQQNKKFALERINDEGDWEIRLPVDTLAHGYLYRLKVYWAGGEGDRIPAYARRVVQDPHTLIFNAQVWNPSSAYAWLPDFKIPAGWSLRLLLGAYFLNYRSTPKKFVNSVFSHLSITAKE